jgi:hypothetical protein
MKPVGSEDVTINRMVPVVQTSLLLEMEKHLPSSFAFGRLMEETERWSSKDVPILHNLVRTLMKG